MLSLKTSTAMKLLPVVCLCLLTRCGITSADGNAVVKVEEDRDVILPCSLSTKENIESYLFDWRKAAQDGGKKEVFYYNAGEHYNDGYPGQSEEFKGRVFHFPGELKHGNASIIIRNTKLTDSGHYTCDFPNLGSRQTFHIELVVDCVLKDRTPDKKPGTCPKPILKTLGPTKGGMLLQCEVRGASPIPKVELKDSSGKILSAEPQVTDRGGLYDIILRATVTKTDNYSCVSTQEDICHQISADTHVPVNDAASKPSVKIVRQTNDGVLLQCEVSGASPKPKVEWKDSSGNKLPAEEPQVTDKGGSYDIILQTTVTKTDDYSCVVTQEEINHQISAETFVPISGFSIVTVVVAVLVTFFITVILAVVVALLVHKGYIPLNSNKDSEKRKPLNDSVSQSEQLQPPQTSPVI